MLQINKIELASKLADIYEWHEDFHFTDSRKFKYEKNSDVIIVTKGSSIFGFSISINQNKKFNKPFAYLNLIKINNLDRLEQFEKVISLGNPIDLSIEKYELKIIQELDKVIHLF